MTVTNKLNTLILIAACIVSDGSCLAPQKAEEQPFGEQHAHVKMGQYAFTANAVLTDSTTYANTGKVPE